MSSLFLSTKIHFSFDFGFEFFTIFPFFSQTVKAGCVLHGLHAFLSLSCCTVFALASAIKPSSNIAPTFASSSAFSLPSVTNYSKCDISFLSFFVRYALTCSTSTNISLDVNSCNSSQTLIHKSASPVFGSMHLLSPYHGPSVIPLLSTVQFDWSHNLLEKAKECRRLRPLDGALDLKFCLHRDVHPMQKLQLSIIIQSHH